jgi:hypothetical protein
MYNAFSFLERKVLDPRLLIFVTRNKSYNVGKSVYFTKKKKKKKKATVYKTHTKKYLQWR